MSRNRAVVVALIDSHPLMRECIHHYLSGTGYTITWQVTDGLELISQVTNDKIPSICLLEFNARKKIGYETIKMLKTTWPQTKIVIYSMLAGPVENKKQPSGADVIISNTTSLAELKNILDQLTNDKSVLA